MSRRRLGHQNIFGSQSRQMNKRLLAALILSQISFAALSQGRTQHLGLQEAIAASITSNNAIKLSALDVQIARTKFRQSDAVFLPQANISYTAITTNNPLNAFGFKLQQRSITETDFNPEI